MTTVVLIHNAWHGAWCWDAVTAGLTANGTAGHAVELPLTGIADDVAELRAQVDRIPGEVILCAHSYGGAVAAHALPDLPSVRAVLYLCSFVPGRPPLPPGHATALGSALTVSADHVMSVDPHRAAAAFYADCPPELAAQAVARLRPTVLDPERIYGPAAPAVSPDRPWDYAVCTQDQAMHPADQRIAARGARRVHAWPTGHSPMLAAPDLVTAAILATATSSAATPTPLPPAGAL